MQQKRRLFACLRHTDVRIMLIFCALLTLFLITDLQNHLQLQAGKASPLWRIGLMLLLCLLLYTAALLRRERTGSSAVIPSVLFVCFLLYLYLLLCFTLVDQSLRLAGNQLAEAELSKRAYYLKWFVNLRPFESIYAVYIRGLIKGYVSLPYMLLNLFGNLCAFMPLAFFLPVFFPCMKRWYCFVPTVILSTALVEGLQFWLMVGSCDIDDLILNAGGAVILYFLLRIPSLSRLCKRITDGNI